MLLQSDGSWAGFQDDSLTWCIGRMLGPLGPLMASLGSFIRQLHLKSQG